MASNLRIFFVGGLISFRALFNWIKPSLYIPTMLGSPLFQIIFFTYLGRYALGGEDDASSSSATRCRCARCRPCTG
jgi:ABC-2 type transport system permease protein